MTVVRFMTAILLATTVFGGLAGCDQDAAQETSAPASAPKELSVDQVSELLSSSHRPKVFDANSDETRARYGTLPGATLLDSPSAVQSALPEQKDEKLLFYCGSTRCQAAEGAARKALAAGYQDVSVMPAGIKGWKAAGKPTEPFTSAGS